MWVIYLKLKLGTTHPADLVFGILFLNNHKEFKKHHQVEVFEST